MSKAKDPSKVREVLARREAGRRGLWLSKSRRADDRGSWYVWHSTQGLVAGGPGTTLEDVERLLGRTEDVDRLLARTA